MATTEWNLEDFDTSEKRFTTDHLEDAKITSGWIKDVEKKSRNI